jgi:hypothetical protein
LKGDKPYWQWGGTLVVHEVSARPDGSLGVRPPAGVVNAFAAGDRLTQSALRLAAAADGCAWPPVAPTMSSSS